jgi:hypothetical protein
LNNALSIQCWQRQLYSDLNDKNRVRSKMRFIDALTELRNRQTRWVRYLRLPRWKPGSPTLFSDVGQIRARPIPALDDTRCCLFKILFHGVWNGINGTVTSDLSPKEGMIQNEMDAFDSIPHLLREDLKNMKHRS